MADEANGIAAGSRVVLLRDRRWPQVPGVCCWRRDVRRAFTAAGAAVEEITARPPAPAPAAAGPPGPPRRMVWLPQPARTPLVWAYRGSRSTARRVAQRASALGPRGRSLREEGRRLQARLGGAALVVAESLDVAEAALAAGMPATRLWALALPAERLFADGTSGYGAQVARLAPVIGGFLTDSEPARESVERAAAGSRPRVVLFPPLALDERCPECASAAGGVPEDTRDEVRQLAIWRAAADLDADALPAFGFPAARLLGLAGPWASSDRLRWDQSGPGQPWAAPAGPDVEIWSGERQRTAARAVLQATLPRPGARTPRSVVISGFDLKFVRELGARLDNHADLRVDLDEWPRLGTPSPRTAELAASADVVFAEWARPSAVWLTERKQPGQLLVVRLHRYELDRPYPRRLDMDKVDAVVHVSPPIARRIREELGWPAEKLVYIPNFLDVDWLDRPKLPEARFGLGFVGMEFENKRFDLALDILAEVRRQDPRFTLFVRSVMPWDNVYAWARPGEREFVGWCMARIEQDPLLRGGVVFESPGRDMARWYRRVGHVLSMSDIESFHLAAAEGMASGAVPIIRPWPGSDQIYGREWIRSSVAEAAAAVLANADEDRWREQGARARAEIRGSVDPEAAIAAWADLLHGDVAGARSHFGRFVTD